VSPTLAPAYGPAKHHARCALLILNFRINFMSMTFTGTLDC
jgi:hypothetical protein